jgi:vacuolar-type H+-ATPase subunit H
MSVKKDYNIDVTRLLDKLSSQIEDIPSVMGISWGLNKENLRMQIGKIQGSLPRDVLEAAAIKKETDRIIDDARQDADSTLDQSVREAERILAETQAEADKILEEAKAKQLEMLSESEIMKLAAAQAEELKKAASVEADGMRHGADEYARDVLGKLEARIEQVRSSVERSRSELGVTSTKMEDSPIPQEELKV